MLDLHYLKSLSLLLIVLTGQVAISQNHELYEKSMIVTSYDTLPFRIMKPKNFDPSKEYPLIVFLHGSGERGNDNEKQLTHGASYFASDSIREKYPAVVVFPQCDTDMAWHNGNYRYNNGRRDYFFPVEIKKNRFLNFVEMLIDGLVMDDYIDQERIYVGGLSMGGMGTFELVNRNPGKYAAAFAVCGAANPEIADRLQFTSWWIFHGEADNVVSVEYSKRMYEAIKKKTPDVKLTTYPDVQHDSWTHTFREPELMTWLLSRKKY